MDNDQNTYVGPPPRVVDHTLPADPYIDQLNPQAYAAPFGEPQPAQPAQPIVEPVAPEQAEIPQLESIAPIGDPNLPPAAQPIAPMGQPAQPVEQGQMPDQMHAIPVPPEQNPNNYNTPELAQQIQMAQQAGQAAQAQQPQTVSAQMMAQNPPEPGTARQTYKTPLVIPNGIARAFAYLAFITVIVAIASFIGNQFKDQFSGSEVYAIIMNIIARINTVAVFARIACVGFAVTATVIRVLNPHPYNTKNAITGWVFALISLLALVIFR